MRNDMASSGFDQLVALFTTDLGLVDAAGELAVLRELVCALAVGLCAQSASTTAGRKLGSDVYGMVKRSVAITQPPRTPSLHGPSSLPVPMAATRDAFQLLSMW